MTRWKPEYGEKYWFVGATMVVFQTTWTCLRDEDGFYETGNCFKTKEEAEEVLGKFKAVLKRHWEGENKKDYSQHPGYGECLKCKYVGVDVAEGGLKNEYGEPIYDEPCESCKGCHGEGDNWEPGWEPGEHADED